MKVNVLGTEYVISEETVDTDKALTDKDGYCDTSVKKCVIDEMKVLNDDSKSNIEDYKKSVIRHELIHAFTFESGLDACSWARNEEMVDWIAIQFPKMLEVFEEAKAL